MGALNEDNPVHIGVDIGKQQDPSAICVSEVIQRPRLTSEGKPIRHSTAPAFVDGIYFEPVITTVMETAYITRYLARLPLGMDYKQQAEEISRIICSAVLRPRRRRVLIDVTGVGRGVFDFIASVIYEQEDAGDVELQPVSFIHGDKYDPTSGTLGKAYLVSRGQVLLQNGCWELPASSPYIGPMTKEMLDYEIRINPKGVDTYGAFKTGAHDDLCTAGLLSTLEDPWVESASVGEQMF